MLQAEIDDPLVCRAPRHVHAVHPRSEDIGIGPSVGVRGLTEPFPRLLSRDVERTALGVAHERDAEVSVKTLHLGQIDPGFSQSRRKVGVDGVHDSAIKMRTGSRSVTWPREAHEGDAYRRPIDYPLITPRLEDRTPFDCVLQRPPIHPAPNGVGGDEADVLRPARFDLLDSLHEPIADQIYLRRHPAFVHREELRNIVFAEVGVEKLSAKERWIPDHDIGFRPFRLSAFRGQARVAALDGIERFQDGVVGLVESVAAHPLDLADPHRHPGQLGGVGVDLEPLDVGRADGRERARKPHRLGFQLDSVLQVLERVESEIEKVARTAGGIKHGKAAQIFEEGAKPVLCLTAVPRSPCPGLRFLGAFEREEAIADFVRSQSASRGRITVGSMIRMILSRSV